MSAGNFVHIVPRSCRESEEMKDLRESLQGALLGRDAALQVGMPRRAPHYCSGGALSHHCIPYILQ